MSVTSILPNHKKGWTGSDYRTIAETLAAGLSWDEAAARLGRRTGPAQRRANFLLDEPVDYTISDITGRRRKRQPWEQLQERLLADPGYDWETIARAKHAAAGLPYWDDFAEDRLRQAWESAAPQRGWLGRRSTRSGGDRMRDLVVDISVHEADIADRLIELGYARTYSDVAARLGAMAGGALEARARLAAADHGQALHVLTITDTSGTLRHSSLHVSREDAELACAAILQGQQLQRSDVRAQITCRYIGRLSATSATSDDDLPI